jgi:hypothetical protein
MPNITFSIEEDLLLQMKVFAAKGNTSINALVRDHFAHLISSGVTDSDSMNGNLQTLFAYSIGRISRHKARQSLGVDDTKLALMLREAGFPPPRASSDQEDAMLESIKNVHLA